MTKTKDKEVRLTDSQRRLIKLLRNFDVKVRYYARSNEFLLIGHNAPAHSSTIQSLIKKGFLETTDASNILNKTYTLTDLGRSIEI